jgi:hypothetical protein
MEIPEYVEKKLEEIAKKQEVKVEEIKKQYTIWFQDPFILEDPQFETDEDRHRYAIGSFWSTNMSRQKVVPKSFIPIGCSPIKKSKSTGLPYASLFVIDEKGKLRRISFNGNSCFKLKEISWWNMYRDVKLKEFKDSDEWGADDRAEFENPEPVEDFDPKQIIENLKIPKIPLPNVSVNPSNTDSSGYTIQTDWKCLHGYITFESSVNYDDGEYGESGKYIISEPGSSPSISDDGVVNQSGLVVWTSPTIMNYPKMSECYFLGTTGKYVNQKTNETLYNMNCFCIIPIIVRRD